MASGWLLWMLDAASCVAPLAIAWSSVRVTRRTVPTSLVAVMLVAAVFVGDALLSRHWSPDGRRLGRCIVAGSSTLLLLALCRDVPFGGETVLLALLAAFGATGAARWRRAPAHVGRRSAAVVAVATVASFVASHFGRDALVRWAFVLTAVALVAEAAWTIHQAGASESVADRAVVAVGRKPTVALVAATVAAAAWVGANSPTVGWFGAQVSHGPRSVRDVALTFDDGPNVTATLQLAAILEAHGARGTFFSVGKAVDARPDLVAKLHRRGHIVANHSYHHDSTAWLDPRYPELARTDASIRRATGVCPAFYRAPHGQHTPLLALVVHRHHETMVGWEVSAGDWKSTDPAALARLIVRRARPGSIIDLHDGLDGDVTADRSVLVRALPLILDGLKASDLRVVGLDHLLGRPATRPSC